jgi:hypothetical protein
MKYCPNPRCPPALRFGRRTEFRDSVDTCTDCGTTLVSAAPPLAATRPLPASDATERLLVTLGAMVATIAASSVGLLGTGSSVASRLPGLPSRDERTFSLLAFGLTPFLTGFLVVELAALVVPNLRALRVGTLRQRTLLRNAGLAFGVMGLMLQCQATTQLLTSEASIFDAPSPPLLWAQLLLAHLALAGLALAVSRWGLGNGFVVVGAASAFVAVLKAAPRLLAAVEAEVLSIGMVLALLGVLGGIAWFLARASTASRRVGTGTLVPSAAPFPISSLTPSTWAAQAMGLPAVFGLTEVTNALQRSSFLYFGVATFIAFDLALLFAWLFFRPEAVAALWKRWHPDVDETGVIAQARSLLPRALVLSLLAAVAVPVALWLAPFALGVTLFPGLAALGLLVLGGLDLVEEYDARRRLGRMVPVHAVVRCAEVEPVLAVLRKAGIDAYAQSAAWRASAQFFGPEAPVMILVPEARAAEARTLVDVD